MFDFRRFGITVSVAMLFSSSAIASAQQASVHQARVVYAAADGVIALDPKVRIGRAPNGTVYVMESKGGGLFAFLRGAGSPVRVLRKGAGPGEYQKTLAFGWQSDTLWFSDTGTQRVTLLPQWGKGKPSSEIFVGARNRTFMTGLPFALGRGNVAIVGAIALDQRLTQGNMLQQLPVLRTTRDGSRTLDTMFHLDVRNSSLIIDMGADGGRIVQQQPLDDGTLWADSRNGDFVAVVDRTPALRVALMRTTGQIVYRTTPAIPIEPLSQNEARRVSDRQLNELNDALRRLRSPVVSAADFRRHLYVPTRKPPVLDVIVADDGTVALRGNDWNRDSVEYTILNALGGVRTKVALPARQYVRAIVGDTLWSVLGKADGDFQLIRQTIAK